MALKVFQKLAIHYLLHAAGCKGFNSLETLCFEKRAPGHPGGTRMACGEVISQAQLPRHSDAAATVFQGDLATAQVGGKA
jgi:hypothetical protein